MKALIILAALLSTQAFADTAYMKIGDIKGESTDAAPVIDEVMEKAENVKETSNGPELVELGQPTSGEGTTGQARRRGDVVMKDVTVESKRNEIANTKASDYNSSRSNRTTRDAATGLPTGKRQHRKLDTDDDDDGVLTTEVCDAVDNDCDDTRADNDSTKSGGINTIKSSCTLKEKLKGNKICPKD